MPLPAESPEKLDYRCYYRLTNYTGVIHYVLFSCSHDVCLKFCNHHLFSSEHWPPGSSEWSWYFQDWSAEGPFAHFYLFFLKYNRFHWKPSTDLEVTLLKSTTFFEPQGESSELWMQCSVHHTLLFCLFVLLLTFICKCDKISEINNNHFKKKKKSKMLNFKDEGGLKTFQMSSAKLLLKTKRWSPNTPSEDIVLCT